jgi:hypothetical protein
LAKSRNTGHVFHIDRLDLVAQRGINRLAALVVRPGPTIVADRAKEDEADLDLVFGQGGFADQRGGGDGTGPFHQAATGKLCHWVLLLVS